MVRGRALVGSSSLPVATRLVRTPPNTTLYEAIAIDVGFALDPTKIKEYEKDCEQLNQQDNNDQASSGGGGGSGGDYYYGGGSL